jgi:hypothetical protein
MHFTGTSPDGALVEIVEIPAHPWFLAVQFHPEFKSQPIKAHPLFAGFVGAAVAGRHVMDDPQPDEKKIIIDEDWKAQVEAERARTRDQDQPGGEAASDTVGGQAWPPPSLPLLITTLATEAMIAMGVVAHPLSGEVARNLDQARHFIDMIAMLQEKTQGNCTAEETEAFELVLHELRMTFVAVQQQESAGG